MIEKYVKLSDLKAVLGEDCSVLNGIPVTEIDMEEINELYTIIQYRIDQAVAEMELDYES